MLDTAYRLEYEPDVSGMRAVKLVNELFTNGVEYRNSRFIKKSSWYDDDVANELDEMTKKIAIQMKDRIINGKYLLLMIKLPQTCRVACDA